MSRFFIISSATLSCISWFILQGSPAGQCDPSLAPRDDAYGYHLREDRCEGIYIKPVGANPLLVASLTESFEDFNPDAPQKLQLEWPALGDNNVRLRAQSFRQKLYYRMDCLRPADNNTYTWSPDLLATFKIKKNELGIVARTEFKVGATVRDVYLPLRIRQQSTDSSRGGSQLVILPGIELTEVYLNLAPVKADGNLGNFIMKDQALGYGYYPADRKITIILPELKTTGIYYLGISATLSNGGSREEKLWLYHPGKT
ncbi:MAG: hypothetical protein J2P41_21525 [Blastocatellia bacterium]|nr:hypothetical protein [Blastocatellia bacterium]